MYANYSRSVFLKFSFFSFMYFLTSVFQLLGIFKFTVTWFLERLTVIVRYKTVDLIVFIIYAYYLGIFSRYTMTITESVKSILWTWRLRPIVGIMGDLLLLTRLILTEIITAFAHSSIYMYVYLSRCVCVLRSSNGSDTVYDG